MNSKKLLPLDRGTNHNYWLSAFNNVEPRIGNTLDSTTDCIILLGIETAKVAVLFTVIQCKTFYSRHAE